MERIGPRFAGDLAHRAVATVVRIIDEAGAPLVNTGVSVEQVKHAFGFGNIGFDFVSVANGEEILDHDSPFGGAHPELAKQAEKDFFDLFNFVTLPFYWAGFEPEQGRPDTERLKRAAQWIRDRGAEVKGHPLAWHTLAPKWLLDMTVKQIRDAIHTRITRDVTDFAGVIDMWDAINEVVIMPIFDKEENGLTRLCQSIGRIETIRLAVDTAREANPGVTLLLNDFNMSSDYERLIEECLDAGIQLDALGLQSHMHQGYWGEEKTREILGRFSRFGLPIHMTETTLVSGHIMPAHIVDLNDYQIPEWPSTSEGEARQAEEIQRHYTTVFSHPNVEALTYWGFSDDGSWLGAPVGLVRRDGSAKPSLEALRGLIKGQWWVPPTQVVTDDQGCIELHGCAGRYRVECDEDAGAAAGGTRSAEGAPARTSEFDATPATGEVTIRLS
ncbi:MAG: endo-1,4-beta-xylanase [Actinomycetaceae bacterium]|nr:endo-1,4-beta-xylanase [Actinomycetaceae bacterium]